MKLGKPERNFVSISRKKRREQKKSSKNKRINRVVKKKIKVVIKGLKQDKNPTVDSKLTENSSWREGNVGPFFFFCFCFVLFLLFLMTVPVCKWGF